MDQKANGGPFFHNIDTQLFMQIIVKQKGMALN